MQIDYPSVLKAGLVGAILNIIIGILGGITGFVPVIGFLTIPVICCGWILIPVLAGALYGNFAPGEETIGQSALGGAISGFVAGLMYGVFNGLTTAVWTIIDGADFVDALAGTAGSIVLSCCLSFIVGGILGAIGGAIWIAVQQQRAK